MISDELANFCREPQTIAAFVVHLMIEMDLHPVWGDAHDVVLVLTKLYNAVSHFRIVERDRESTVTWIACFWFALPLLRGVGDLRALLCNVLALAAAKGKGAIRYDDVF
jgi:hypothetical protein